MNHRHVDRDVVIDKVQLSDLENAAHLPKPRCVKGMLAVNDNWRSPEGRFKAELNKLSDLFSFGLVVSAQHGQEPFSTDTPSTSTLFLGALCWDVTITFNYTNPRERYLHPSAFNDKYHTLETKKG